MAQLTIQVAATAGLEATYAACTAGGDKFQNDGRTLIHIKNGHSSPQTVTIAANVDNPPPGTIESDQAVAVTNAEERLIWVPQAGYNDANGDVNLSYSGVTALTIAIIRVPS